MNKMKVNLKSNLISVCFFLLGFVSEANAQEVTISADRQWCEGEWVTLSVTVTDCTVDSLKWYHLRELEDKLVDGSDYFLKVDGNDLKSLTDGKFRVNISCTEGHEIESSGDITAEPNEANCT